MNKNSLVSEISKSKLLKNLCIKLCNRRDIHNDLYQEFFLYILLKEESFLIEKYNTNQLIPYCSNVIKGLNSNRIRDNKAINSKNTLIERHNENELINHELIDDASYNYEIDIRYNKTVEVIKEYKYSEIIIKSSEKTLTSLSRETGINYRKLITERNKIKEIFKKK
jgi:hypothetical protein